MQSLKERVMRTKATAQNTTTTMATVMVTTMARTTGKSVRHPHLSTCTPHIAPGAALALGFAFMLVVDHVSGSYGHGTYTVKSIMLTALQVTAMVAVEPMPFQRKYVIVARSITYSVQNKLF